MKNDFAFRLSPFAFLALLLCSSCSEKELPLSDADDLKAASVMQKIRQDAKAQWDASKKKLEERLNNSLSAQQMTSRSETAPCNCAYHIEDAQIQTPPEHPDFELDFFSPADCVPGNPFECPYFTALYFSGPVCGGFIDPDCGNWWTELPPQVFFPFNCQVPAFASFPVSAASIWVNESCDGGDLLSWSITFRIYCQESEPNPTCGLGSGYGFVSDPITLSGTGIVNWQSVNMELTECGCKPVLAR